MSNPQFFYNPQTETLYSMVSLLNTHGEAQFLTLGEHSRVISGNVFNCIPIPVCDSGMDNKYRWLVVEPRGVSYDRISNGRLIAVVAAGKPVTLKWVESSGEIDENYINAGESNGAARVLIQHRNGTYNIMPTNYIDLCAFDPPLGVMFGGMTM